MRPQPRGARRGAARAGEVRAWTRLSRRLRELSYGQLRRVLFARACVKSPRLLLLDEPFAGVDAPTRRALRREHRRIGGARHGGRHGDPPSQRVAAGTTHELELADGRMRYGGRVRSD